MNITLTNATIVLRDSLVHGSLHIRNGLITDIQHGPAAGIDCDGDTIIPGAIDLHTDNLERQVMPRNNARWPSRAALLAHDTQCAAAGITTVFDALCIGHSAFDDDRPRTCREGIADLNSLGSTGLLKADHLLHLRCELPAADLLAQLEVFATHNLLRLVSLMDHTPGGGQFQDLARYRGMRRHEGDTPGQIEASILAMQHQRGLWSESNRTGLLARLAGLPVAIASHDDATEAEVHANAAQGIGISEFPVSLAAARAARAAGMDIIAGAPNLVRGGSHSGNVAVSALLEFGLVDLLASDYVPSSLVHAAFLAGTHSSIGLPAAIAMISQAPARMARLPDRGAIAPGLRADLVRVRLHDGIPVVRQVWRAGERVI